MNNNTTIHTTYQFYITIPIIIPSSSSSYVYLLLSFLIFCPRKGKNYPYFFLFVFDAIIHSGILLC